MNEETRSLVVPGSLGREDILDKILAGWLDTSLSLPLSPPSSFLPSLLHTSMHPLHKLDTLKWVENQKGLINKIQNSNF